jgi:hypothetical protein
LVGVRLIQAYSSFFGREYHALRTEVDNLGAQVDSAIGERVAAGIVQTVLQNNNTVEFWQQYCEITMVPLETDRATEIAGALRQSAQELLRLKAGTPLDAVAPDDNFTRGLANFERLRGALGTYNGAVAAANAVIAAKKRQTQTANPRDLEHALAKLKAQKARHTPAVRQLCESELRFQIEKTALELEKGRERERNMSTLLRHLEA